MSDTSPPARTAGRRPVRFDTPDAVLADVARLRAAGYRRVGQWSLPQVCHHLSVIIAGNLTPPPNDDPPTAEQLATKEKFFATVLAGMPEGMPAPAAVTPPASADDAAIDGLAAALDRLATYPHAAIVVGRCGPVPTDEVRRLHLVHAAHHLSFLEPTTVRRPLDFRSPAEVVADAEHLRRGYVRSGNWTLPQACWHLRAWADSLAARPMSEPTPEMLARRPLLDAIMAGAPLPDGRPALDELLPPATAGDADVEAFLALMRDRQQHPPGPAMHRLWGPLTAAEHARLTLVHCGHHLSFLVPDAK